MACAPRPCPPGKEWDETRCRCVRTGEDYSRPNPRPAPGGCPPGQVPKTNGQGCKPEGQWWDESPDELSRQGIETCDESEHPEPKDCYWCDFDTRTWKRGYCPEGGAGGGGGRGAAAPRTAAPAYNPGLNIDALLSGALTNYLNMPSRYSPQVIERLYGNLRSSTEGRVERRQADVRAQAARQGMSRAGFTGARLDQARREEQAAELGAQTQIQQDKLRADFEDRVAALDRAQRYLDSARDHVYRMGLSAQQQQQFSANLALAYAQLRQQWDMLLANQGFMALYSGTGGR